MSLYSEAIAVLSPLVGRPAAEICMRSSAMKLGKSAEELRGADIETVAEQVRGTLGAFASKDLIEQAMADLRSRLR